MNQRFLFIGPPGAGKGTQAGLFSTAHDLIHLSTGDLLRAEVELQSVLGQQASELMDRGELVNDELVLAIVKSKLEEGRKGWLLDGFPRNVAQAKALEILLEDLRQPIDAVILLEVKDVYLIDRLLSRGRTDDNEVVIRNRLAVYREQTAPLIDYYRKQGLLVSVEAEGTIEEVFNQIEIVFKELV